MPLFPPVTTTHFSGNISEIGTFPSIEMLTGEIDDKTLALRSHSVGARLAGGFNGDRRGEGVWAGCRIKRPVYILRARTYERTMSPTIIEP